MGWGWYLQNDMQLFIYSLFLLFIYTKKRYLSFILIWLSLIGAAVFTFVWTYQQEVFVLTHLVDFAKWGTFFSDVYIKPWARASPYLFGLFLGIIFS